MKKFGLAEWLTVLVVFFAGIMILIHPEMMDKIFPGAIGSIIVIAYFIGYNED